MYFLNLGMKGLLYRKVLSRVVSIHGCLDNEEACRALVLARFPRGLHSATIGYSQVPRGVQFQLKGVVASLLLALNEHTSVMR